MLVIAIAIGAVLVGVLLIAMCHAASKADEWADTYEQAFLGKGTEDDRDTTLRNAARVVEKGMQLAECRERLAAAEAMKQVLLEALHECYGQGGDIDGCYLIDAGDYNDDNKALHAALEQARAEERERLAVGLRKAIPPSHFWHLGHGQARSGHRPRGENMSMLKVAEEVARLREVYRDGLNYHAPGTTPHVAFKAAAGMLTEVLDIIKNEMYEQGEALRELLEVSDGSAQCDNTG